MLKRKSNMNSMERPTITPGLKELFDDGLRDPRWSFTLEYLRDEHWWVIGWRADCGFPLFHFHEEWTFRDYSKAFHEFLESPEVARWEWVVTHHSARPSCFTDYHEFE